MEAIDAIREILVESLDVEEGAISENATFESLGVDSLDMVEMTCDLEDKLGVSLGEPDGIETVGDLVSYIESL